MPDFAGAGQVHWTGKVPARPLRTNYLISPSAFTPSLLPRAFVPPTPTTAHHVSEWVSGFTQTASSPTSCVRHRSSKYPGVTPPIAVAESSPKEKELTASLLEELRRQGMLESEEEAKTR